MTAITIEANFANAYYLSDPYADIAYDNVYKNPTNLGWQVPATYHEKTVYTDLTTLFRALSDNNPNTQAIVLVGNFHYNVAANNGEIFKNFTKKGVTIMSVDEDNNQEPDYGWYSFMGEPGDDRQAAPPLRFDFVPNIGIGMSARVTGSSRYPTIGIFNTRGWFELTETCVSIMNETETEDGNYTNGDDGHGNNRWIANSGYFLEFVRGFTKNATKLSYVQIGGNAYVEKFYPGGPHFAKSHQTKLCPVLVTGGELEECFITGKGHDATVIATGDNIYFWCAGGRIHKWLGAYMVKPQSTNCKVTARLDHAIVRRFFGGGTSPLAAITGDIDVTVNNSFVNFYCGGPEFGNMNDGKAVTTRAKNTVFGEFYGAGFGGTAITYENKQDNTDITFDHDYPFPLSFDNYTDYRLVYNATNGGFGTCYYYDLSCMPVARMPKAWHVSMWGARPSHWPLLAV